MLNLLITGASGVLGRQVLADLAACHHKITVISRDPKRNQWPQGITVLKTDLCDSESLTNVLKGRSFDQVIHMAACVRWNQPEHIALEQNVRATKNLLKCFQYGINKPHFIYVSTAFVDKISCDLSPGPGSPGHGATSFNNTYEMSKYMAEQEVSGSSLPWSILRPSIIIGHSKSGVITGFNGMYQLLKIYLSGRLPFIIGEADSRLDLCPVDEVSKALKTLLLKRDFRNRISYASSAEHAIRLSRLIDMVQKTIASRQISYGLPAMKPVPLISNEHYSRFYKPMAMKVLSGKQKHYLDLSGYFLPYLCIKGVRQLDETQNLIDPESAGHSLQACLNFWCDSHDHLFFKHYSKSSVEPTGNRFYASALQGR